MSGGAFSEGRPLSDRRLYLCTPDRPDLERFVASCIEGGVSVVQLRDKDLAARQLVDRARKLLRVCHDHGAIFVLNDRPDLALEAGADGVHIGQDDASASLARRILGPHSIIGLSTHSPGELGDSLREPVDYVSAGPVVETPTKPGRAGTGIDYVRHVAAHAKVPWFVTGGVAPETVRELVEAGARQFVVVRYLTESPHPQRSAHALSRAIEEAIGERG